MRRALVHRTFAPESLSDRFEPETPPIGRGTASRPIGRTGSVSSELVWRAFGEVDRHHSAAVRMVREVDTSADDRRLPDYDRQAEAQARVRAPFDAIGLKSLRPLTKPLFSEPAAPIPHRDARVVDVDIDRRLSVISSIQDQVGDDPLERRASVYDAGVP